MVRAKDEEKFALVNSISQLTNSGPEELGRGSKERKSVLINLAVGMGLGSTRNLTKHELAKSIANALSITWDESSYQSTGQTITNLGLQALLSGAEKWFTTHPVIKKIFPYKVCDTFSRNDLHTQVGGSFRQGMTSCHDLNEFFLFHDEKKGKKFGYDKWDGEQADGTFSYTGQGQEDDQRMTAGNLALVKAHEKGRAIRLIESKNGVCTYLGEYVLGNPEYRVERALDKNKVERNVFVFNLVPVESAQNRTPVVAPSGHVTGVAEKWTAPNSQSIPVAPREVGSGKIDRLEHKLQENFGNYLLERGIQVENYKFNIDGTKGSLQPDLWLPTLKVVVEIKASSAREYVRTALGQVLDYSNLSQIEGSNFLPTIVLPRMPAKDLVDLISKLGILLIVENGDEFLFIPCADNKIEFPPEIGEATSPS